MNGKLLEYFRKWIIGPLRDIDAYRELAHTIGAFDNEKPGMSRNNMYDSALGPDFIQRWNGKENVYVSLAFYDVEFNLKGYAYLYYDFDYEENPDLAIKKGLEFASSIKKRYGVTPVTYLSGFKGLGVIIPLKEYVDWSIYQVLWKTLVQPYTFTKLVDTKVLDARRLHRIPWTFNIKKGEKRLSKLIDLNGNEISPSNFDWDLYEPLDVGKIEIYKIEADLDLPKTIVIAKKLEKEKPELPNSIEELKDRNEVPPCVRNIIRTMITVGDVDHYARLVLVWYLKWIGFYPEDVLNFFAKHANDFNEKIARYQIEYAYGLRGSRKDYIMPSCRWMNERGLCLNCGWNRNPVTYTYSKARVDGNIMQRFYELTRRKESSNITSSELSDHAETIARFIKETGKSEFTYEDFKSWLEERSGRINAREWHKWERILRLLAEKGYLGRKYLVNEEWVDYGPGKVDKPPSKAVKFYVQNENRILWN